MTKRLIYLFGDPGTGKITTARVLQRQLGWRLFWLHDLDAVCRIVGRYPLPRLMDDISLRVLQELMWDGQDLIYVRPSRDAETRTGVKRLAESRGYRVWPVRLWASYDTLIERVEERGKGIGVRESFRVTTKSQLDEYLNARPGIVNQAGECLLNTDGRTPEQVAGEILEWAGLAPEPTA